MQEIAHHPEFGRSFARSRECGLERVGSSAAVVRDASARESLAADRITVVQHVARWGITVAVIALCSALYGLHVHAMLR